MLSPQNSYGFIAVANAPVQSLVPASIFNCCLGSTITCGKQSHVMNANGISNSWNEICENFVNA